MYMIYFIPLPISSTHNLKLPILSKIHIPFLLVLLVSCVTVTFGTVSGVPTFVVRSRILYCIILHYLVAQWQARGESNFVHTF